MHAIDPHTLPVLYSFRRCPYAMRARLDLRYAGVRLELREVDLNALPEALVTRVPDNQTVPVLVLPEGRVLDESWDVLLWALRCHDPDAWLGEGESHRLRAEQWIEMNDYSFKADLDHYKYADRYPEYPQAHYREEASEFIQEIEEQLAQTPFLLGDSLSVADIGLLPFVRQFAFVDKAWFDAQPWPHVQAWLDAFLNSALFAAVMDKVPLWQAGDPPRIWP